jgi:hypothetical protein
MSNSPYTPYLIILAGLLFFATGVAIDVTQHGKEFLIQEFQEAPLAHGLPLVGIAIVIFGTALGWLRLRKDSDRDNNHCEGRFN